MESIRKTKNYFILIGLFVIVGIAVSSMHLSIHNNSSLEKSRFYGYGSFLKKQIHEVEEGKKIGKIDYNYRFWGVPDIEIEVQDVF